MIKLFNSKDFSDISLDEVIRFIENDNDSEIYTTTGQVEITTTVGVIRIVSDDISIRTGKYGNYIFYKTAQMKKPKFISLKTFKLDYNKCGTSDIVSWVKTQI